MMKMKRLSIWAMVSAESFAGRSHRDQPLLPASLAVAMLLDDRGWSILDERFTGQLGADLFDFFADFFHLGAEAFFLCGGIDDAFKRQIDVADGALRRRRPLQERPQESRAARRLSKIFSTGSSFLTQSTDGRIAHTNLRFEGRL